MLFIFFVVLFLFTSNSVLGKAEIAPFLLVLCLFIPFIWSLER